MQNGSGSSSSAELRLKALELLHGMSVPKEAVRQDIQLRVVSHHVFVCDLFAFALSFLLLGPSIDDIDVRYRDIFGQSARVTSPAEQTENMIQFANLSQRVDALRKQLLVDSEERLQ
jgi:hypothetical protein